MRAPRLQKNWGDVKAGVQVGPKLNTEELFFHVCFALLFGKLRLQLQDDQDCLSFLLGMLAVWSLLASAADYATRFNDDDSFHKMFWAGHGLCLVSLLMHCRGAENLFTYHFSMAFGFAWIGLANMRVASFLPECRVFTLFYGAGLLVVSALWLAITFMPQIVSLRFLVATAHQVLTAAFVKFVPAEFDLPMNIEYHRAKFGSILTVAAGQMIVGLVLDPLAVNPSAKPRCYAAVGLGFFVLFSMVLVIPAVGPDDHENHAIRRSRQTALVWLLVCQPSLLLSITATSVGIGSLSTAVREDRTSPFGSKLLCCSVALMFLTLLVTMLQHQPPALEAQAQLLDWYRKGRALLFSALALLASPVLLPSTLDRPLSVLAIVAAICTCCARAAGTSRRSRVC